MQYRQREIVLVPFPYSDLSTSKKRPVLIISNDDFNGKFEDVVVCVITSNVFKDTYSLTLRNEDLEVGMLPEQSVVKAHKLFSIHKSKILRKFSVVKETYFKEVEKLITELVKQKKV